MWTVIGLLIFTIIVIGAYVNFSKHNKNKVTKIENLVEKINTEIKEQINNIKNK